MSFLTLMFAWLVLVLLGIAAIVAAEPLWNRRRAPVPVRARRQPAVAKRRELPCPTC